MTYNTDNLKILHQGIDTLVIGVLCTDINTFNTKFKSFVNKVKIAKEWAKSIKSFGEKVTKTDFNLPYGDFFVYSKGLSNYFGFVKNDDVFFSVSDTEFDTKGIYHIKLQFRSVYLLKYGHIACMEQVKKFLSELFEDKYTIKILRLDLCTDVTGIKYTPIDFFNFRSLKKVSSYSDTISSNKLGDDLLNDDEDVKGLISLSDINVNNFMRFNRFEGISFGKSPHMFRVYDKIKQIQHQNISNLIFTKWELNGFNFSRDMYVFRHEVEFGRLMIKKLIPLNTRDEVDFVFENLGSFWLNGLEICKWYDLTDNERERISSNSVAQTSIRSIYNRVDKDDNRFRFWDFISSWDSANFNHLCKHDFLISKDIKKAKKALKAFISAVYTNLGYEHNNFLIVLDEVKKDLKKQGLNLHEYGLSKLAGNFNKNEKVINENSLDIVNPLSSSVYFALDQFIIALSSIANDDYKRVIVDTLTTLKNQRLEKWINPF